MLLIIDQEFAGKIPPLTEEEYRQLEENILADGKVITPLITWNGIIVDGHNRYRILQDHPEIPYETLPMEFPDRYAVIVWICRNQLGRRNLTDEQKKFLTGKRYEAEKKRELFHGNQYVGVGAEESGGVQNEHHQNQAKTCKKIADEIGKSASYVRRAEEYANGIEAADEAAPGIKGEILSGKLKCKDKDVIAIARASPEAREDLVRQLQAPSSRAAPPPSVISSPEDDEDEDTETPFDEDAAELPAQLERILPAHSDDTIEDVMYELNDALESMIFRWNFCFETHDALYRRKENLKKIRLLAKEGINFLKNIKYIDDFMTKRTLLIYGYLFGKIRQIDDAATRNDLMFFCTACFNRTTRMVRYMAQHKEKNVMISVDICCKYCINCQKRFVIGIFIYFFIIK